MRVSSILLLLLFSHADGKVLSKVQTLYDRSPKLRFKVAGIKALSVHEVSISIGAKDSPLLLYEKDFVLSKDDDSDGIVLKLLSQRK